MRNATLEDQSYVSTERENVFRRTDVLTKKAFMRVPALMKAVFKVCEMQHSNLRARILPTIAWMLIWMIIPIHMRIPFNFSVIQMTVNIQLMGRN